MAHVSAAAAARAPIAANPNRASPQSAYPSAASANTPPLATTCRASRALDGARLAAVSASLRPRPTRVRADDAMNHATWQGLGRVLLAKGEHERAAECFFTQIELEHTAPQFRLTLIQARDR